MSEAAAVAERTNDTPDTAGAGLGDTAANSEELEQASQGADGSALQAGEGLEGNANTGDEDTPAPPPDDSEEAKYAAWSARKTREDAAAKAAQEQSAEAIKNRQELAALRSTSLEAFPDELDKLAERYGITLTRQDHKPFVDMLQNIFLKGEAAARAELGDTLATRAAEAGRAEYTQLATEVTEALFGLLPASLHGKYAEAVRGKPASEWAQIAHDMAPPSATSVKAQVSSLTEAASKLLPADTDDRKLRSEFQAEAGKAKTPAELVTMLFNFATKHGESLPIPPPRPGNGTQGSAAGPANMRDVRLMHIGQHASGKRLTTAEMRSYENQNRVGKFPD